MNSQGFFYKKIVRFTIYNKPCIIQNHNYRWNASQPGISEKIQKTNYKEKFLDVK